MRPLFVELIRAGMMTADEAKRLTAEVRESMEDAAAEAKAQHDAKAQSPSSTPPPPPPQPPAAS
jgi:polyhydroxyalkanoate synthesis regulator phasin